MWNGRKGVLYFEKQPMLLPLLWGKSSCPPVYLFFLVHFTPVLFRFMIWWHTRTHFLSTWWYGAVAACNVKDWFDPMTSITWLSQMDLNRVCCVFCSYAKRSVRGCRPLKSIFLYSSRCHSFTCPAHGLPFFFGNLRRQTQTMCAHTGGFFNRQPVSSMCFRLKLEYSTHT